MALTQELIEICAQAANKITQDCIKRKSEEAIANISKIQEYYRFKREINRLKFTECKEKVPGGCPPRSTEDTQENRNICSRCQEAYFNEEARLLLEEAERIANEQRILKEKTSQRYDPLGNPLPGCECCDEGRAAEAACRRSGKIPIIVSPSVPDPYRLEETPLQRRSRLLYGPIPM